MLNASQVRTKRDAFSDESMSSTPASTAGWLPTMPDDPAVHPGEAARDRHGPVAVHLEVLAVVDDGGDDPLHVVGLVGRGRQEVDQLGSPARSGSSPRQLDRRLLQVVRGQEGRAGGARRRGRPSRRATTKVATPDLVAWLMAPPSSSSVTSSPVTVFTTSGPVMNMCEVPCTMKMKSVMAGRVDGATGARAQDHADLGDDARGGHVAVEDAAVGVQRDDAFLDAGARRRR